MGQLCERAVPPNSTAKCYAYSMIVLMVVQLAISILNFVCSEYYLREGIFGLFFIILLFFCFWKLAYQAIIIIIFFSLFFIILFLIPVFLPVQQGTKFNQLSTRQTFCYSVGCISCAYYIFMAIYLFFPYREFKSIDLERNPILKNYFQEQRIGQSMEQIAVQYEKHKRGEDAQHQKHPTQIQLNQSNYQSKENLQNKKQKGFKAFTGKGVQLG